MPCRPRPPVHMRRGYCHNKALLSDHDHGNMLWTTYIFLVVCSWQYIMDIFVVLMFLVW